MLNFYNEFDSKAAAWLRELIKDGLIPDGVVDERSIVDLKADELKTFTQVHLFAGIGGWSYALELAGWPRTRRIWTGSCPCQPYSAAGKGLGDADPRNLWPHMCRLIRECKPECVVGEQVSSAIGHGWLDGLSTDLEAEGYAVGAVVLGAHSAGKDHIRQRLFWVANSKCGAAERRRHDLAGTQDRTEKETWQRERLRNDAGSGEFTGGLANPESVGRGMVESANQRQAGGEIDASSDADAVGGVVDTNGGNASTERQQRGGEQRQQPQGDGAVRGLANAARGGLGIDGGAQREAGHADQRGESGGLGDADGAGSFSRRFAAEAHGYGGSTLADGGADRLGDAFNAGLEGHSGDGHDRDQPGRVSTESGGPTSEAGCFIQCADGKARRTQRGIQPLVAGLPKGMVHSGDPCAQADATAEARVMRLKGYGNAICAETAAIFLRSVMTC